MDAKLTGAFIAQLRKEKNLTQTALAQKLNVSNRTVSKWENGDGYPDITILPEIAKALNVTVDEILKGEKAIKEEAVSQEEIKIAEKGLNDSKLWFIISLFSGLFAAVLGVSTKIYCTWAFAILFFTHWEIIFDFASLFALVFSIGSFVIGVYKLVPVLDMQSFNSYCKEHIKKFLLYFSLWFSFPFAFIVRIVYLSNINIQTLYGNLGMYFLFIGILLYIISAVIVYRKYK